MTRHEQWLVKAAILAGTYLSVAALVGVGPVDDTFIFLRYAQNILNGHGAVFNPGERVEGYTSPLWLACTTVVSAIFKDPPLAAVCVGGAIGFTTVVLVARRTFLGAMVLAAHPGFVFWSFSGMETPLSGLTLALAALTLLNRPLSKVTSTLAGVAFAAACLTRPDSIVLAPVFLLWITLESPAGHATGYARSFLLPLVGVLIHAFWRRQYYGDWLPNTAYAKAGIGLSTLIGPGVRYLPGMWVAWAGSLFAVSISDRRHLTVAALIASIWSVSVALVGGDFFPFARFGVSVLPLLAALAPASHARLRPWRYAVAIAASLLLFVPQDRVRARQELVLARGWGEAGQWLKQNTPADVTIATLVAGSLPYYSQRRAIDLLGLTDRHIARYGNIAGAAKVGHQKFDSEYVLSLQPDIIVLQDSGRWRAPRFGPDEWPWFSGGELDYVQAMVDLMANEVTRSSYRYRPVRLSNGSYLEALWRTRQ